MDPVDALRRGLRSLPAIQLEEFFRIGDRLEEGARHDRVAVIRGAWPGADTDRAYALPRRCGNRLLSNGFVCRLKHRRSSYGSRRPGGSAWPCARCAALAFL